MKRLRKTKSWSLQIYQALKWRCGVVWAHHFCRHCHAAQGLEWWKMNEHSSGAGRVSSCTWFCFSHCPGGHWSSAALPCAASTGNQSQQLRRCGVSLPEIARGWSLIFWDMSPCHLRFWSILVMLNRVLHASDRFECSDSRILQFCIHAAPRQGPPAPGSQGG